MFALKGADEFCPSSPACFKLLWTSKDIISFDVIVVDPFSDEVVFDSNIVAHGNSTCTRKKKRKNKRKERQFDKKDMMCSTVCTDEDTELMGGVEYQVDATATIAMSNSIEDPKNESMSISYLELNRPVRFKIADDTTKFILSIKKRPRSFNVTSDNKVKLKARIKLCEENSLNGTIISHGEENVSKDISGKERRRNKTKSGGKSNNQNGNGNRNNKTGRNKKNQRNKNGKDGKRKDKSKSSKNKSENTENSSKDKNVQSKKNGKGNRNKGEKTKDRRRKNDPSKQFKVTVKNL